jgi:hypothetical protein
VPTTLLRFPSTELAPCSDFVRFSDPVLYKSSLSSAADLQTEGLIHTSPGQRPGIIARAFPVQAEGMVHTLGRKRVGFHISPFLLFVANSYAYNE